MQQVAFALSIAMMHPFQYALNAIYAKSVCFTVTLPVSPHCEPLKPLRLTYLQSASNISIIRLMAAQSTAIWTCELSLFCGI